MIVNHIFLLFLLSSSASAFGSAGAYERLWFYYAYRVDTADGTRAASKIAVGCANAMHTGGVPCSFNQFLQYIDEHPANYNFAVTNDPAPPVEATADELSNRNIGGSYLYGKIRTDVKQQAGLSTLMASVTRFLEGTIAGASQVTQDNLKNAVQATKVIRQSNARDTVKEWLESKDLKWAEIPKAIFPGATTTQICPDNAEILALNPELTAQTLQQEMVASLSDSKGHGPNLFAVGDAHVKLNRACA